MVVLGVILIVLALAVFAYVWFATADLSAITVDLGAFSVLMTPLHLFLVGGATVLVLAIGAALLSTGLRRRQHRRRELKDLRTRAAERDRLHEEQQLRDRDEHGRQDQHGEHGREGADDGARRDPTVPEPTAGDDHAERRDPHTPRRDDPRG